MRAAKSLVGAILVGAMVVGCGGSNNTSPIERAEYRYRVKQPGHEGITSVSCDQRGPYVKVDGVTYSGHMCHEHGGGPRIDNGNFGAWWDGHKDHRRLQ